jgi:imidazolonepropionase-like amidohydrolase
MIWNYFLLILLFQPREAMVEKGSFKLHLLSHAIGEETYEIAPTSDKGFLMKSSFEYSDRGTKRPLTAMLRVNQDLTPVSFEVKGRTTQSLQVNGQAAEMRDGETTRSIQTPGSFFVGIGYTPVSVQMLMMRYWAAHGRPALLPVLPDRPTRNATITFVTRDPITIDGKTIQLDRYSVAGMVFGREVLWMDDRGELAGLMTFAGGLPFEGVRSDYEPAYPQLFRHGVEQELRTLSALSREVLPSKKGTFAIVGATLADGTDRAPVPDSVVIVRDGRISAAGPRSKVPVPGNVTVIDAKGQMLLPGLWEMHTHYSGTEFGPALLAAGITTARDCGGEFEFLVAARDAVEKHGGLGPRLLLAGLVDGGGPAAFGEVTAETADEARAVVARYHAAGFQQIKLYTVLKPEVIKVLAFEAHRLGMTVTGHVPAALDTFQGVEAGMDQINHLNYVTRMMREPREPRETREPAAAPGPIDINSERTRAAIEFLRQHRTVVDPTVSWGEMAGHSKETEASSFEPGVGKAPEILAFKFTAMGAATESAKVSARMRENLAVIGALHKAGIPIVAGSDTGLVGYGLLRELELYVEAGMSPLEAIQSATIVPARAMKLDKDSGTIETGKRADLILVNGNPLENISDLRKISAVIANGRMFDSTKLWQSVGFRP